MKRALSMLLLGVAACAATSLSAQTISVGTATGPSTGGATTPAAIPVTFTRNAAAPVADFAVRVGFNNTQFTATAAGANGGSCAVNQASGFVTVLPPPGQTDIATNPYCNVTFTINAGAPANTYPLTPSIAFAGGGCFDASANTVNCTLTAGSITVTGGGGGNTPPNVAFNPIGGTTINYNTSGVPSPAAIAVTPSGGAGSGAAATTTVGACNITGGGAAFPTTTIAQISFVGNTTTPQNLTLPTCVPQAAAVNATLTCPVSQGGGAAVNTTFPLACPAAAVATVPPTLIYQPAPGNVTISGAVGAAVTQTLDVSCNGAAGGSGTCTGSGAGTARLQNVTVTGFSPSSLTCGFFTEGGAAAASPLNFVAGGADPGDIRCTCLIPSVNQSYIVSATEIPNTATPGTTVLRSWNVTCGAGQVCGTISANPASGTVTLNNGGGATLVTTVTTASSGAAISRTVNCALSGVNGATFNVTTSPSPLTIVGNGTGTVSATCSNSNVAAGTATLTCTSTSSDPQCPTLSATYTLSCPGVQTPPSVTTVPVPALGEQGRILLAALMLALGLVIVGFRLRG